MKKLFFVISSFAVCNILCAQNDSNTVKHKPKAVKKNEIKYYEFDYLSDEDASYNSTEKYGNSIGIKIKNINLKVVNVSSTVTQNNFNTEAPPAFSAFNTTSVPQVNQADSSKSKGLTHEEKLFQDAEIANVRNEILRKKIENLEILYENINAKLSALTNITSQLLTNYKYIKAIIVYEINLITLSNTCNIKYIDMEKEFVDLTKNTFLFGKLDIKQVADISVGEFNKGNIIKNKTYIENYISKIIENYQDYYLQSSEIFGTTNISDIKESIDSFKENSNKIIQTLKSLPVKDNAEVNILTSLLSENKGSVFLKRLNADMDFLKFIDVPTLKKNVDIFSNTWMIDFEKIYNQFNERNYTYYGNTSKLDHDLTTYIINITPKSDAPCTPIIRNYEINVRPKGHIKVDFSTGLFGNFGGNNFLDQSYRYDTVQGISTVSKIVKNKSKNAMYPSVGALMHIYDRWGTDFQPALCFGISTKDAAKINYHFGISMIFGYSQRFILSFGGSLAKTTLLDDSYYEGQVVDKDGAPQTIPTSDFNRFGYFLSFTYNLSASK